MLAPCVENSNAAPILSGPYRIEILAKDQEARQGYLYTAHGILQTPAFMPVGTAASVKALTSEQVSASGAEILLGNTYHLMLRPGLEIIAAAGGLHKFMNWPHPILTDSGGFQVMSLAKLRKVQTDGVHFQSHIDGRPYFLTPEHAMEIQAALGSDIQMQLDECVALPAPYSELERAMHLSLDWAERSLKAFQATPGRGVHGIIQGGDQPALRRESAQILCAMPFGGFSVGGLAVGETQATMLSILDLLLPYLPQNKPRYLMGVGTPDDLLKAIARGIDMFDCVLPTRAGRHGLLYSRFGKMNLRNARYATDFRPLDETSSCPAAQNYSRAYLHHLIKSHEILAMVLLSWINLTYYQELMRAARQAISEKKFTDFCAETQEGWEKSDG